MRICTIGLGRLGLAWSLVADAAGHDVVGYDIDTDVVEAVNRRRVLTHEPLVTEMLQDPGCRLRATSDARSAVATADVSVVMVPTPSRLDGSFSADRITDAVTMIGDSLRSASGPHVVVILSTMSPGTTAGPVRAALERAAGRVLDDTLGLVHCPEFHAIGSVARDVREPDLVVVGALQEWAAAAATELVFSLTTRQVEVIRMSPTAAELTKLSL